MNNESFAFYNISEDISMENATQQPSGQFTWNQSCPFDIRSHDMSAFTYDYRKNTWRELNTEEIVKIALYVAIILISIVGNVLVVLVVYFNHHMRTSTNQYLVNLAIADLLVTLCCTWVHLVRHLSHPNYVLPSGMCKLEGFIITTTLTASVFTLTVISIGRFIAVIFPLHAHTSPNRAHRNIFGIWIISALIASPTVVYRQMYSIKWADYTQWQCDEFWPVASSLREGRCVVTFDTKKAFNILFILILYFIPVTIMLISYSMVAWRLWANTLPGEHAQSVQNSVTRSKKKVVKMVSIVLLAFVFCWTPLQSLVLYSSFFHSGQLPGWFSQLEYAAYFIAHANSAINPILYCCFNASFSEGLKFLLHCKVSPHGRLKSGRMHSRAVTGISRDTVATANSQTDGRIELRVINSIKTNNYA